MSPSFSLLALRRSNLITRNSMLPLSLTLSHSLPLSATYALKSLYSPHPLSHCTLPTHYLKGADGLSTSEMLRQLPAQFDSTGVEMLQGFATSKDGTLVG